MSAERSLNIPEYRQVDLEASAAKGRIGGGNRPTVDRDSLVVGMHDYEISYLKIC